MRAAKWSGSECGRPTRPRCGPPNSCGVRLSLRGDGDGRRLRPGWSAGGPAVRRPTGHRTAVPRVPGAHRYCDDGRWAAAVGTSPGLCPSVASASAVAEAAVGTWPAPGWRIRPPRSRRSPRNDGIGRVGPTRSSRRPDRRSGRASARRRWNAVPCARRVPRVPGRSVGARKSCRGTARCHTPTASALRCRVVRSSRSCPAPAGDR